HTSSTRDWSSDVCSSDLRIGRLPKRRIVDLGDDLGENEDRDRGLEGPDQIAEATEHGVGETPLRKGDAVHGEESAEVAGVALLRSEERRVGKDGRWRR